MPQNQLAATRMPQEGLFMKLNLSINKSWILNPKQINNLKGFIFPIE